MRGKAQRVARTVQKRAQKSGVTGSKFTKFSSDRNITVSFKARIRVAIFPSVVGRQRTEW